MFKIISITCWASFACKICLTTDSSSNVATIWGSATDVWISGEVAAKAIKILTGRSSLSKIQVF